MNMSDLEQRLIKERIPIHSYSLKHELPNEVYCIYRNNDLWEVYYSERGRKSSLKNFYSEEEACDYFYNWLITSLRKMGVIK